MELVKAQIFIGHITFRDKMKTMSCRQLGGACDKEFHANTFEDMAELSKKHGMHKSPTYICWQKMKDRCLNPNHIHYHSYGGRGINICDKWMSFEGFFEDMGEMPEKGYSVDRINSDGNYTKENCRWIPKNHQQKNRRKSSEWIYTKTDRCGKTYKGKQK